MFSELFDETPEDKEVRLEHDSDKIVTHRRQNRCPQTVITGTTQGFREHDLQCQDTGAWPSAFLFVFEGSPAADSPSHGLQADHTDTSRLVLRWVR